MRRAARWSAAVVVAASVFCPRPATAGLIDFIWEMSGPQMIGTTVTCEFDVEGQGYDCRVPFKKFVGNARPRAERQWWITLDVGGYFSTGTNSDLKDFEFGRVGIGSFEPTVDVVSYGSSDVAVHHGAGMMTFRVFGKDFRPFTKVGLKFVPLAVTFRRFKGMSLAYQLRLLPDGFTSDEFETLRTIGINRNREWSDSLLLSFGHRW